jgi:hypothetical protein
MILDQLGRIGMNVQLAEPAAKILVLVDREALVAKEDHEVVHQRIMNFLELLVAQRLRQIDAVDFGADGRRQLAHVDGLVAGHDVPSHLSDHRLVDWCEL